MRKHLRLHTIAWAGFALAFASQAWAATYYVTTGGSDSADGSQATPWATLQHAADSVAAGDEVLVGDGQYTGFQLTTTGTESARIIFRATSTQVVINVPCETGDGIRLENVSYVTVEGFHVIGATDKGIAHRGATPDAPSHGLIIRGNLVENTNREGMYLSEIADSLVENNVIRGSGASGESRSHGLYLANAGSDNTIIRGNDISNAGPAESNGIHINGDLSVGGDGIISGLLIERNLLHDNAQNGLNLDGVQSSLIQNNLIYGNSTNGIRGYAIDGAAGPRDMIVINNTIIAPVGWCVRFTEDAGGLVVFNNILLSDSDGGGSIGLDQTQGFASSHNAVSDRFTPDRDETILTLTEWQALGYDDGSFLSTAADLFVAPGTDYKLRAGSPAIDVGVASFSGQSAPTTDLAGAARPNDSAFDLGAYEYCTVCEYPDGGTGWGGSAGSSTGGSTNGGSGGSSAGGSAQHDGGPSGGAVGDSGLPNAQAPEEEDSGCGCHLEGRSHPMGLTAVAVAFVVGLLLRRSRRR